MTFILTDLADGTHDFVVSHWIWRMIADWIEAAGILPDKRNQTIGFHLMTELNAEETRAIADVIEDKLSDIRPDQRHVCERLVIFLRTCDGAEVG